MTVWTNKQGDTIKAEGTTYTITREGVATTTDISKWHHSAAKWIQNDIKDGKYTGFILAGDE